MKTKYISIVLLLVAIPNITNEKVVFIYGKIQWLEKL